MALLYVAYAHLARTSTPAGATTAYAYMTTPGTTTTTTNKHWIKKTLDGWDGR